ncbi:MAG: hypothetical protein NZL95_08880 [Chitinophagales bacterium]|nr:hypothetical protein [Chitinophagales bacterium]MDW8428650.1 hypothetical protein [Chitinophagales bacterium]
MRCFFLLWWAVLPFTAAAQTSIAEQALLNQPLSLKASGNAVLNFIPKAGSPQVIFIGDLNHASTPVYFEVLNRINEYFRHHAISVTALVRGTMLTAQPADAAAMPPMPFTIVSYCENVEASCRLSINDQEVGSEPLLLITDRNNTIRRTFSRLTPGSSYDEVYLELNKLLKQ